MIANASSSFRVVTLLALFHSQTSSQEMTAVSQNELMKASACGLEPVAARTVSVEEGSDFLSVFKSYSDDDKPSIFEHQNSRPRKLGTGPLFCFEAIQASSGSNLSQRRGYGEDLFRPLSEK